ncbi:type II toxin-antitoxin system VapB family antitoxin [Rhizobium sp. SAFR-030]|uniref:type II toxin-antitoxin system VapB family antitoxin n=1 Tax=Rhizobium sp. SAFR-030 TaxID=3387277 RepID=UPI003F813BE9
MSMIIRDPVVDALAAEVMQKLGAKTKAEAIRLALENELKRGDDKALLADRVKEIQDRVVARMGSHAAAFDEKAYMDEMWGN